MSDDTDRPPAAELDDFTISKSDLRKSAILVLRRKGWNQDEVFEIDAERLRSACSEFLDTTVLEELSQLSQLRKQLSGIERQMPHSGEVANQVVSQIGELLDKVYDLPKK